MKFSLPFASFALLMSSTLAYSQSCSTDENEGDILHKLVVRQACSKQMTDAIQYREKGRTAKKNARLALATLCCDSTDYTSACVIMAKDAGVMNATIAKACEKAKKESPLCILTQVSLKKSDADLVSACAN